jgi:hypothetical protein
METLAIPPRSIAPGWSATARYPAALLSLFSCCCAYRSLANSASAVLVVLAIPFMSAGKDGKSGEVDLCIVRSQCPVRCTDHSRRAFMSFVFQWPRRPLVKRIGFPPPRLRSLMCRRSLFTPASRSSDRAATAFAVKCLLQRLCHVPSNPYATVIVAAAHPARALFASRVDSNSTRPYASTDAPRRGAPACLLVEQSARPAWGRALRYIPVKYADASEPYLVVAAPCPMCRKRETRQIPNYSSVSHLP